MRSDRLILTMMRSCASAAKLRAAGPFYRSASTARFEYGFPPPRIVNSAVVLKASASAENVGEWYPRSGQARSQLLVPPTRYQPVLPFRCLDPFRVIREPDCIRRDMA